MRATNHLPTTSGMLSLRVPKCWKTPYAKQINDLNQQGVGPCLSRFSCWCWSGCDVFCRRRSPSASTQCGERFQQRLGGIDYGSRHQGRHPLKLDDFDGVFANFRIIKHGYGVDLKVTANCRTGKLKTETNPEWRDIMPGSNFYHISKAYCGL